MKTIMVVFVTKPKTIRMPISKRISEKFSALLDDKSTYKKTSKSVNPYCDHLVYQRIIVLLNN